MLGQRSIYHDGLAGLHRAPTDLRVGQVRAGRVGALRPRARPLTVEERRRRPSRNGSRRSRACGSTTPGSTTACRSTTAQHSSRCSPNVRTEAPDRQQYTYYPHVADVPESAGVAINGRSYTIAAGVEIDSADAQGVLYAHGGVAGGHSLYVKDKKLRYTFNWLGTKLYDIVADTEISPGSHVFTAEFASQGSEHRSDHARVHRNVDALRRHEEGR